MGYPNLRLKFWLVQYKAEKCSKYKMRKNGENRFTQKIAVSVTQYFNSCRSNLHPNENFLETKMISEKCSINPANLTRFGSGHCNGGRDPMEIPICFIKSDNSKNILH